MIHICGRKVKVQTGTKSQTVNVCSSANIHGEYDYIVRLPPPFISEETLLRQNFGSMQDLVRYLERHHFGEIERAPVVRSSDTIEIRSSMAPPAPVGPTAASSWERNATLAVEQSIDQFILEFIDFPYLHRVEHSVHCELFKILTSRKILSRTYLMGRWATQPIHKEWPEFLPRPEKGNRRGNFDLLVLAPERLKSCSFTDFREGRVRPSIVIEVGLDYDFAHLSADATKPRNSGIQHSYLVHLVRQDVADDFRAVEQFLLDCGMRTGYARLTSSQAFYKLVNDDKIQTVEIPLVEFPA
jgi:hypothetical protein